MIKLIVEHEYDTKEAWIYGQIKSSPWQCVREMNDSPVSLPPVPAEVQRLVFDRPVDVRFRVPGGLTVQDGGVALVYRGVLRLRLEANVHCVRVHSHTQSHNFFLNQFLTLNTPPMKLTALLGGDGRFKGLRLHAGGQVYFISGL